jgi:hypothetical protein
VGIKQASPGEGGRKARAHFTYVPTDPKRPWNAYVAGPCMWFTCHTKGRSKPCLESVTDGELTCPRCNELDPPQDIGYQPLYRAADSKPVMVIVHDYTREIVDSLRFHSRVLVSRGHAASDGVMVNPALDQLPKFQTALPERMRAAQPIESLLRLWGIPELIQWHNETEGTNFPVCITPPRKKPVPAKEGKPAPAPASAPAGDMAETALEAMERIRLRNEAFVRDAKSKPGQD